jgi:hypothetical protein
MELVHTVISINPQDFFERFGDEDGSNSSVLCGLRDALGSRFSLGLEIGADGTSRRNELATQRNTFRRCLYDANIITSMDGVDGLFVSDLSYIHNTCPLICIILVDMAPTSRQCSAGESSA